MSQTEVMTFNEESTERIDELMCNKDPTFTLQNERKNDQKGHHEFGKTMYEKNVSQTLQGA